MWHRVCGSTVILWSYENTFCVQRKRKCLLFHVSSFTSRGMHTQASWYSCEDKSKTGREEKKLLNKIIIFVFFAHNRYSHSFITLKLNHWCHICTILLMSLLIIYHLSVCISFYVAFYLYHYICSIIISIIHSFIISMFFLLFVVLLFVK